MRKQTKTQKLNNSATKKRLIDENNRNSQNNELTSSLNIAESGVSRKFFRDKYLSLRSARLYMDSDSDFSNETNLLRKLEYGKITVHVDQFVREYAEEYEIPVIEEERNDNEFLGKNSTFRNNQNNLAVNLSKQDYDNNLRNIYNKNLKDFLTFKNQIFSSNGVCMAINQFPNEYIYLENN